MCAHPPHGLTNQPTGRASPVGAVSPRPILQQFVGWVEHRETQLHTFP